MKIKQLKLQLKYCVYFKHNQICDYLKDKSKLKGLYFVKTVDEIPWRDIKLILICFKPKMKPKLKTPNDNKTITLSWENKAPLEIWKILKILKIKLMH